MKAYAFTEADIMRMLSNSLIEGYKKKFFVDIIQSQGLSVTAWLQTILMMYVHSYQSLDYTPLSVSEHNRIYDSFEPVERFISKMPHSATSLDSHAIYYVFPVETVVSHYSDITDGFDTTLYDDLYVLIEDSLGLNPDWNEGQTASYPTIDIFEKLESMVEVTKHLVTSVDQVILPYRNPDKGIGVAFTLVQDILVIFVDD